MASLTRVGQFRSAQRGRCTISNARPARLQMPRDRPTICDRACGRNSQWELRLSDEGDSDEAQCRAQAPGLDISIGGNQSGNAHMSVPVKRNAAKGRAGNSHIAETHPRVGQTAGGRAVRTDPRTCFTNGAKIGCCQCPFCPNARL